MAAATTVLLATTTASAQQQPPMKPTAPGTRAEPAWQGVVRASDGRSFITDGGLAIDVTLVKPAKLPDRELPGKVLEQYFASPHKDEYRLNELRVANPSKTYVSPSGVLLNATYVDYLRKVLPAASVLLRMNGDMQPIVVAVDGKAVGVLMPVRK